MRREKCDTHHRQETGPRRLQDAETNLGSNQDGFGDDDAGYLRRDCDEKEAKMSPRKGFDVDGGAFTLSCSALLCCAVPWCGVVCWNPGSCGC